MPFVYVLSSFRACTFNLFFVVVFAIRFTIISTLVNGLALHFFVIRAYALG